MKRGGSILRRGVAILALAAVGSAACAMAQSASVAASSRATWGQILIICIESDGRHPPHEVAELYDPLTNRFALERPVMHMGRTGDTATIIPIGPNAGKVLVAGGFNDVRGPGPLASTELYDPATNTFARGPDLAGPDLPNDIDDQTATVMPAGPRAGWILIVGGSTNDFYDPINGHTSLAPKSPYERFYHTATVIPVGPNKGKILIAGGDEGFASNVPSGTDDRRQTEIYDPLTNRFQPGPRMNTGRDNHTATVIAGGRNAGKILLVGGWLQKKGVVEGPPLASTELYDPATNTFASHGATATLKTARAEHTATLISSGPNAGKILVAGGEQGDTHLLSSTEIYDPATNTFEPGPPMLEARSEHIAITIRSGPNAGEILIAGGLGVQCNKLGCDAAQSGCQDKGGTELRVQCGKYGYDTVCLSSTELYDPQSNTFVQGPPMRGAPCDVVAVQLPPAPSGAANPQMTRSSD
jgi:Galactose oxidase, central domain/Kelch motif